MGGPKIDTSQQDSAIAQQKAQAQKDRIDQIREDTTDATRALLIRFGKRISTGQPAFGQAPVIAGETGSSPFGRRLAGYGV